MRICICIKCVFNICLNLDLFLWLSHFQPSLPLCFTQISQINRQLLQQIEVCCHFVFIAKTPQTHLYYSTRFLVSYGYCWSIRFNKHGWVCSNINSSSNSTDRCSVSIQLPRLNYKRYCQPSIKKYDLNYLRTKISTIIYGIPAFCQKAWHFNPNRSISPRQVSRLSATRKSSRRQRRKPSRFQGLKRFDKYLKSKTSRTLE